MEMQGLEQRMNVFNPKIRRGALLEAAPADRTSRASSNVNMHQHSFFSYNALGWSPSRIAWEARKAGL
jgi:hypothetical protein